jgi:hypothetical protein
LRLLHLQRSTRLSNRLGRNFYRDKIIFGLEELTTKIKRSDFVTRGIL